MPQQVHTDILNVPYRRGILDVVGDVANPFLQRGAAELGKMAFGLSPEEEANKRALDEQAIEEVNTAEARRRAGLMSDEAFEANRVRLGVDPSLISPQATHLTSAEIEKNGLLEAGYQGAGRPTVLGGTAPAAQPNQGTQASQTAGPGQAVTAPVNTSPQSEQAPAPGVPAPADASPATKAVATAQPAAQITVPVKQEHTIAPLSTVDPRRLTQEGAAYASQFLPAQEGTLQEAWRRMDPKTQQSYAATGQRLNGLFNMLKMKGSNQLSSPEELAKIHGMMATSEADIENMLDVSAAHLGLDTGRVRALGGAAKVISAIDVLHTVQDPAKMASLPMAAQQAYLAKAPAAAAMIQQLPGVTYETLSKAVPPSVLPTYLQYRAQLEQIAARDRENAVKARGDDLQLQGQNLQHDAALRKSSDDLLGKVMQVRGNTIHNQQTFELNKIKTQNEIANNVANLGIKRDSNAIKLATYVHTATKDQMDAYNQQYKIAMKGYTDSQKLMLEQTKVNAAKMQSNLDLRAHILAEQSRHIANANQAVGVAGSDADKISQNEWKQAQLCTENLATLDGMYQEALAAGIKPRDPKAPDATTDVLRQWGELQKKNATEIFEKMTQMQTGSVPLPVYNMSLGMNMTGKPSFDNRHITNIAGMGQAALDVGVNQGRSFAQRQLPTFDVWQKLPFNGIAGSPTNADRYPGENGAAVYTVASRTFNAIRNGRIQ